jgi:hypothetical protein
LPKLYQRHTGENDKIKEAELFREETELREFKKTHLRPLRFAAKRALSVAARCPWLALNGELVINGRRGAIKLLQWRLYTSTAAAKWARVGCMLG